MPSICDYKGLYLCPGQVSEVTLEKLRALLENEPENEQIKEAYDFYNKTIGHPNQDDIDDAFNFIRERLNIK